jgi:DNA-binding transcriptional ArsR family regulator
MTGRVVTGNPGKSIGSAARVGPDFRLDRACHVELIGNHMVTNDGHLDLTFSALADPTRRAILARLAEGDATVGELAEPFDMSRPAISKHLRVLEHAGLVQRTRDGRLSRCGLDAQPMQDAARWVERYRTFWEGQLDSLSRFLEQDNHK